MNHQTIYTRIIVSILGIALTSLMFFWPSDTYAGVTLDENSINETAQNYRYEVNTTSWQYGGDIIETKFEPDTSSGRIKVLVRKHNGSSFGSSGKFQMLADDFKNYTYHTSTSSYRCGGIIEFRLTVSNSGDEMTGKAQKCDGGDFAHPGEMYIAADGEIIAGPDSYRSGASSESITFDPVDEDKQDRHSYQAYFQSDNNAPGDYIISGSVDAWSTYDSYLNWSEPVSSGQREYSVWFDPASLGLTGWHTYQLVYYPNGQSYPIRAGTVQARDVTVEESQLTVQSESIDETAPYYPGSTVRVKASVRNSGNKASGATKIGFWISRTSDGSPIDGNMVAKNPISALAINATSDETEEDVEIPVGLSPGRYYVVFEADTENRESTLSDRESIAIDISACLNGVPFCDVPADHSLYEEISAFSDAEITTGCRSGTNLFDNRPFCPNQRLDRATLAVFLLRRLHGPNYTPPKATRQIFDDVPLSHGKVDWINQLSEQNITTGCMGNLFCPDYDTSGTKGYVKRDTLARFITRIEGWSLNTPAVGVFADVTGDGEGQRAIEYMWWQGYTNGSPSCENSSTPNGIAFCPGDYVSRAHAAGFMARAFGYVSMQPRCASLTLTVNSGVGGTLSASPTPDCPIDSNKYRTDTVITLTAQPQSGSRFNVWSGSVSGSSNPIQVTMGRTNIAVTASFMADQVTNLAPTSITEYNQAPYYPGSSIGVLAGVANNGEDAAPATMLAYWISNSNNGDPIDGGLVATNGVPALSVGGQGTDLFEDIYIPHGSGMTPGTYYVVVEADYGNNVSESNEGDNRTSMAFTLSACNSGTFCDVVEGSTFSEEIIALADNRLTGGCRSGVSPATFCPQRMLDRAHLAIFLLRRIHGADYQPLGPYRGDFDDVPASHPHALWIEELNRLELTNGCNGNARMFCPDYDTSGWDGIVTRGTLALFLGRAEGWDLDFTPYDIFADVRGQDEVQKAVEYTWTHGYTNGKETCKRGNNPDGLTFCSDDYVNREVAAAFMSRAFGYVDVTESCVYLNVGVNDSDGGTYVVETPSNCLSENTRLSLLNPSRYRYKSGTDVTVIANPAPSYEFITWRGDFEETGTGNVAKIKLGHQLSSRTSNEENVSILYTRNLKAIFNESGTSSSDTNCNFIDVESVGDPPNEEGHPYAINALCRIGVINEGDDGSRLCDFYPDDSVEYFCPANDITRGDFVLMLVRLLYGDMNYFSYPQNPIFPDSATVNEKYAKAAEALAVEGIVKGFSDGEFKYNRTITRGEAMTILIRARDLDKSGLEDDAEPFDDVTLNSSVHANNILIAKRCGYVKGFSDGTFKPDNNFQRQEAATVLYRVFTYKCKSAADNESATIDSWQAIAPGIRVFEGGGINIAKADLSIEGIQVELLINQLENQQNYSGDYFYFANAHNVFTRKPVKEWVDETPSPINNERLIKEYPFVAINASSSSCFRGFTDNPIIGRIDPKKAVYDFILNENKEGNQTGTLYVEGINEYSHVLGSPTSCESETTAELDGTLYDKDDARLRIHDRCIPSTDTGMFWYSDLKSNVGIVTAYDCRVDSTGICKQPTQQDDMILVKEPYKPIRTTLYDVLKEKKFALSYAPWSTVIYNGTQNIYGDEIIHRQIITDTKNEQITVVGVSSSGTELFLARTDRSNSLDDLSKMLIDIGVHHAIVLDSGRSSQFYAPGTFVYGKNEWGANCNDSHKSNHAPTDRDYEPGDGWWIEGEYEPRGVMNAIVVYSTYGSNAIQKLIDAKKGSMSNFGSNYLRFEPDSLTNSLVTASAKSSVDAVSQSDQIVLTYTPLPKGLVNSYIDGGTAFRIEAEYENGDAATLQQSYTIDVVYDPSNLPEGVEESELALYYKDGNTWHRESSSIVDTENDRIIAEANQLGEWAVFAERRATNVTFMVQDSSANREGMLNIAHFGSQSTGDDFTFSPMTNNGDGTWSYTISTVEGDNISYLYTRGSIETAEQWSSVGITNTRYVEVGYGTDGSVTIDNTATDWGNGDDGDKAMQAWRDPLVTAVTPAANTTIPLDQALTFAWSKAMQPDTCLDVVDGSNNAVQGSCSYDADAATVTFTPDIGFQSNVNYTAVVTGQIAADNAVQQVEYTWNFATMPDETLAPGDIDGNAKVELRDVLKVIGMYRIYNPLAPLDTTSYPIEEWKRADLHKDEQWNLRDVLKMLEIYREAAP